MENGLTDDQKMTFKELFSSMNDKEKIRSMLRFIENTHNLPRYLVFLRQENENDFDSPVMVN